MGFKEGVDVEQVGWFRGIVKIARDLDVDIDSGLITPDEAYASLYKAMESMSHKKAEPTKTEPKKAEHVPEVKKATTHYR